MSAPQLESTQATIAQVDGRAVVVFGGCNYLGLSQHPSVIQAATEGLGRYGLSASASRATTGNTRAHGAFEAAIASFCAHECALAVPDGYLANLVTAQALARLGVRYAVLDERAHPSLRDSAALAGLSIKTYTHLDPDACRAALDRCDAPAVVLTDGVFAADGAVAPVSRLIQGLGQSDRLVVDDCHGFCVLGKRGEGSISRQQRTDARVVVTTTLAKGLGCAGGVVMGTREVIETARSYSSAYICTTPASPPLMQAAGVALEILETEPDRIARLRRHADRVGTLLSPALDQNASAGVPIFAFTLGDEPRTRALHEEAWDAGLWLPLISYPGGPAPVYIRVAVSSEHTDDQIFMLEEVVRRHLPA